MRLYALGSQDLTASGIPTPSGSIDMTVHGSPGADSVLLLALDALPEPLPVGVGSGRGAVRRSEGLSSHLGNA